MMLQNNKSDLDLLLAMRYDNGADFWATPDGHLGIEKPVSTLTALMIISELNIRADHEVVRGAADFVLASVREDGRVRIAPKSAIYPCHTAHAAAALCRNGYAEDKKVQSIFTWLLANRFNDGGWRCNKFIYGRGPETEFSNPNVTLLALDAFRFSKKYLDSKALDDAVETLLDHWTVKTPVGPCHYGMGSLFMQVEYPFLRYILFYYTYVLSFYPKARQDQRFKAAFEALSQKLDDQQMLRVEQPNRKISHFRFCQKGCPSESATSRYGEIVKNLEKAERQLF